MPDAVEVAFHRAAVALLASCPRAIVAVSGGGDSVALLHLMARLSPRRRPDLVVAHLDHGLRRGSSADARFVVALSARLGLRCVIHREDVRGTKWRSESLEEAARRVRRGFLLATLAAEDAAVIATGHTLDDQAETVLMRLVRGAGPAALTAMAPAGPGPFVKPLLSLERKELRAWLAKRRLAFREDPSNADLAFDRNRVRRLVLPVLARAMNPAAARHIVDAAARLREDASYLDRLAREQFEAISRRRGATLALDAEALAAAPAPLASRMARIALDAAGLDPRRVGARHVAAVVALAGKAADGASVNLPQGVRARRRARLVEFQPCVSPAKS